MIISHKYKFIFIHTNKCAGTSIEVSLASVCGDNDIIGPVTLEGLSDDYKHPENYDKNKFEDTMTGVEIKDNISSDCWKDYFKFSVIRNPWDRVASIYNFMIKTIGSQNPYSSFGWDYLHGSIPEDIMAKMKRGQLNSADKAKYQDKKNWR